MQGWSHYKTILVSDLKVDADLADFPLLVAVDDDAEIGARAKADGSDLRFTLEDGTPLDFEREVFAIEDGEATLRYWVRVPSILASGGAALRCWYGNPAATDAQDPPAVWTPSGHVGVWHFHDGSLADSCNPAQSLAAVGSPSAGAGDGPGGLDTYATTTSNYFTLSSGLGVSDVPITASLYARIATFGNDHTLLMLRLGATGTIYRDLRTFSDSKIYVRSRNATTSAQTATAALATDTWYRVAGVFAAANSRSAFIDGVQSGTTNTTDLAVDAPDRLLAAQIAATVAEIRIGTVARSAAWLKFEHANMADAGWQQTWGGEVAAPRPGRVRIAAVPRYGLVARARPRWDLDIGAR